MERSHGRTGQRAADPSRPYDVGRCIRHREPAPADSIGPAYSAERLTRVAAASMPAASSAVLTDERRRLARGVSAASRMRHSLLRRRPCPTVVQCGSPAGAAVDKAGRRLDAPSAVASPTGAGRSPRSSRPEAARAGRESARGGSVCGSRAAPAAASASSCWRRATRAGRSWCRRRRRSGSRSAGGGRSTCPCCPSGR